MERDGAVAVAPDDKAGRVERAAQGATQTGHVLVPGAEQTEQVRHGARGAEIVAVGLEALWCVPALWASHATEAYHL